MAVHLRNIDEGADDFNRAWLEVMDANHLPVRASSNAGLPLLKHLGCSRWLLTPERCVLWTTNSPETSAGFQKLVHVPVKMGFP